MGREARLSKVCLMWHKHLAHFFAKGIPSLSMSMYNYSVCVKVCGGGGGIKQHAESAPPIQIICTVFSTTNHDYCELGSSLVLERHHTNTPQRPRVASGNSQLACQ